MRGQFTAGQHHQPLRDRASGFQKSVQPYGLLSQGHHPQELAQSPLAAVTLLPHSLRVICKVSNSDSDV